MGGALVRSQDALYDVAREAVIKHPEVHGFGGVEAIDQQRSAEAVEQANNAFRMLHVHGLGRGMLILLVSIAIVNLPLAEGVKKARCILVSLGIGRTFQTIRLFTHLSVYHNVWVALRAPADGSGRTRRQERRWVEELLAMTRLLDRRDELAGHRNFGEQRRLELARALATEPALLLLDEPAAGMNYAAIQELIAEMQRLCQMGHTIFLIEPVMDLVMEVADRIAALNFGEKIAEGASAEIQANPQVIAAYLGTRPVDVVRP